MFVQSTMVLFVFTCHKHTKQAPGPPLTGAFLKFIAFNRKDRNWMKYYGPSSLHDAIKQSLGAEWTVSRFGVFEKVLSQAWWVMTGILSLRRLRQGDCHESEASLGYTVSSELVWATKWQHQVLSIGGREIRCSSLRKGHKGKINTKEFNFALRGPPLWQAVNLFVDTLRREYPAGRKLKNAQRQLLPWWISSNYLTGHCWVFFFFIVLILFCSLLFVTTL